MAIALNKTSLKQQRDQLAMYQRFLPSLDLKRQQLISQFQNARQTVAATENEIDQLIAGNDGLFALLGSSEMDLSNLVKVRSVQIKEENVLGVRLPVLVDVQIETSEYSTLAKPFWVDILVEMLRQRTAMKVRLQIERERSQRLGTAVRRITQRVNLFEKVLIPQAESSIQRIQIYLADSERAAVVRSKIAKAKQRGPRAVQETA